MLKGKKSLLDLFFPNEYDKNDKVILKIFHNEKH